MLQAINSEGNATEWQIGEGRMQAKALAPTIVEVWVDEDELIYILARFQNIPRINPEAEGQLGPWVWFGDHAKFIVANL